MFVKILLLLQIVPFLVECVPSIPNSPCPEIFRYDVMSDKEWSAKISLISDWDLIGVWVRLHTKPNLHNISVSHGFVSKFNETEIKLANRDFVLKKNTETILTISGNYINGEIPEITSVLLNARVICSSDEKRMIYKGDFNNDNYLNNLISKKENLDKTKICGKASSLHPLTTENWPWQADILNKNGHFLCEATLISESTLLTSAHCLTYEHIGQKIQPSALGIRFNNLNDTLIFDVKSIKVHCNFNDNLDNDIALIKLAKPVEFNENIQPICLTSKGDFKEAYIYGNGFNKNGIIHTSGVITERVTQISDEKCLEFEPKFKTLLNDDNMCATYIENNGTSCVGVSGSGIMDLTSETEPKWELKGMVNVGRGLLQSFECNQKSPVLILNIAKYLHWIEKHMNE